MARLRLASSRERSICAALALALAARSASLLRKVSTSRSSAVSEVASVPRSAALAAPSISPLRASRRCARRPAPRVGRGGEAPSLEAGGAPLHELGGAARRLVELVQLARQRLRVRGLRCWI